MAESRKQVESPKPLEWVATFFAYFATAKDAPEVMRKLWLPHLLPAGLRFWLLGKIPSSDFWLSLSYLGFALLFGVVVLVRTREPEEEQDTDTVAEPPTTGVVTAGRSRRRRTEEERTQDGINFLHRARLIQILRSLGLVLVREKILDRMGVVLYGTFRRPPPPLWDAAPERAPYLDRINFTNGEGFEFQYARDYAKAFVRMHAKGTSEYSETETRRLTRTEAWILWVASNFFWRWAPLYWWKGFRRSTPIQRQPPAEPPATLPPS